MVCRNSEHYADDLEVDLEACMLQDFHVELQDDSPRQVSRLMGATVCLKDKLAEVPEVQVSVMLVSLHQECLQGNFSRIQQLQQRMNSGFHSLAKSQQEVVCTSSLHPLHRCIYSGIHMRHYSPLSLQ